MAAVVVVEYSISTSSRRVGWLRQTVYAFAAALGAASMTLRAVEATQGMYHHLYGSEDLFLPAGPSSCSSPAHKDWLGAQVHACMNLP